MNRIFLVLAGITLCCGLIACRQESSPEPQTTAPQASEPQAVTSPPQEAGTNGTPLIGQFSYMADAARFVDCRSGKSFPVATEGAYRELEKAYLSSDVEPGSPLLVEVFGKFLERPGMEEGTRAVHFIVDEFTGIPMNSDCTPNRQASLENTRWKLVELADGQAVSPGDTNQEPLLTLRPGEKRATGSGGCNNFFGPYETSGEQLSFGVLGSTRKGCSKGMEIEQAFHAALAETTRYSISGEFLTLYADDKALAKLEAIYL